MSRDTQARAFLILGTFRVNICYRPDWRTFNPERSRYTGRRPWRMKIIRRRKNYLRERAGVKIGWEALDAALYRRPRRGFQPPAESWLSFAPRTRAAPRGPRLYR